MFPKDPSVLRPVPLNTLDTSDQEAHDLMFRKALGLNHVEGDDILPEIIRGRFFIYQYNASERLFDNPDSINEDDLLHRPPTLELPAVSDEVVDGSWYVVAEITFAYATTDHDHMNWRILVELETCSVLYLRALASAASGLVFLLDPISATGNLDLSSDKGNLQLNPHRNRVALTNLDPPEDGVQHLKGKYVKLIDVHDPAIVPPRISSGKDFDYDVRTNEYAAVSAYFHTNQVFEVIESLGFSIVEYFKNTKFPIQVDHRGMKGVINAHCVGDGLGGISHACYGIMDDSDTNNPLGRACDPRVHWHELCGHGILYEAVDHPNLKFAHSAGDGLAGIFFDPESNAPGDKRYEYVPWHPTTAAKV